MRWSVRFLVLAPVVLVLAGCSAVPGATSAPPSPSPLALASREPSPEPSAALSGPPSMPPVSTPRFVPNAVDAAPIPSDTYARVVTNDLRVRSKPGVANDSIKLEPLLQDGVLLVVVDGPVQASGYDWYQVQPTRDFRQDEYPFGWVAAADKDGEPWIQSGNLECPPLPHDIDDLAALSPSGRMYYEITCFGGREVTFQARIARPEAWCGVSPSWTWEPAWFSACEQPSFPLYPVEALSGPVFQPAWSPDVDTGMAGDPSDPHETWPIVEVTGMFDHPSAKTCTNRLNDEEPEMAEPDSAQTIVNCRIQFVVTSMREIEG